MLLYESMKRVHEFLYRTHDYFWAIGAFFRARVLGQKEYAPRQYRHYKLFMGVPNSTSERIAILAWLHGYNFVKEDRRGEPVLFMAYNK